MNIIDELKEFVNTLKEKWSSDLISVVLFGSYASEKYSEESDIDLVIVKRNLNDSKVQRRVEFLNIKRDLIKKEKFRRKLFAVLLTPEEAQVIKPFYLGILNSHIILYDKDNFFQNILLRLKQKLDSLGAERRFNHHGHEYWILKKDYKPGDVIEL